jgi:hypothetical protein
MDFIHGDSVVLGVCSNLSESGLRGTFSELVLPPSEGLLTLYFADQKFEVQARVDSLEEDEARVLFQFRSDKERSAIVDLLKLLASGSTR